MQERRERLRHRALSTQQPRRAVSALPILDSQSSHVELEDEQSELVATVGELRRLAGCERACYLPLTSLRSTAQLAVAPRSPQAADSLKRSSSYAATSPLALVSTSSFSPSASRRSPSPPRLKLRRRRVAESPAKVRPDANGGYGSEWTGPSFAPDPPSSEASAPQIHVPFHRSKRVSRGEPRASELVAATCGRADDTYLGDAQQTTAVETALKVLGAVLVLSPVNSRTSGSAAEGTGAAAHLLIDSSRHPQILSGMQMKQHGRILNSQKPVHSHADDISIKFLFTNIGSSVTVSSDNTDTNSTDVPVVAIDTNSLKMDSIKVGSDQSEFMLTGAFPEPCNAFHTNIISNDRTDEYSLDKTNPIEWKDSFTSNDSHSNITKESNGAYYIHKDSRKLHQKISREVAMMYALMKKHRKISDLERKQCFQPITPMALTEMDWKKDKTYSLEPNSTLVTKLTIGEEGTEVQPTINISTCNEPFLYSSATGNKSLCRISGTVDKKLSRSRQNISPAETFLPRSRFNSPMPPNSKLNASTDWDSPASLHIFSRPEAAASPPVGSQPVGVAHSYAWSRKSAGHSSYATSDTSCPNCSQKFGTNCDNRQRHSFTIPEVAAFLESSSANNVNRSPEDENRVKHRRSRHEASLPCKNDKLVSRPSSSATVLTSSTVAKEVGELRHVSSSLVISPPLGFASPASRHTRPSTPVNPLEGIMSTEYTGENGVSSNVVTESNLINSTAYGTGGPSSEVKTHVLQSSFDCSDPECSGNVGKPQLGPDLQLNTDCVPSLPTSAQSSLSSSHYAIAFQSPYQSPHPSCPSSPLVKLKRQLSSLYSSSCQSHQPAIDYSCQLHEIRHQTSPRTSPRLSPHPPCQNEICATSNQNLGKLSAGSRTKEMFQRFCKDKAEILQEESVEACAQESNSKAYDIITATDTKFGMIQPSKISTSNVRIQEQLNIPKSDSGISDLGSTHVKNLPGTTNMLAISELTVIPESSSDISDSITILPPTSKLSDITVTSDINTSKAACTPVPIISRVHTTLTPEYTGRNRSEHSEPQNSASLAPNMSHSASSSPSVSNTFGLPSVVSKFKSSTQSPLVSKLPDRKVICTSKSKLQIAAGTPTAVPTKSELIAVSISDPKLIDQHTVSLTNKKISNEISLSASNIIEEVSGSSVSEQDPQTSSETKVLGDALSSLKPSEEKAAQTTHRNIPEQMADIVSDVKLPEQKNAPLPDREVPYKVPTSVSDHMRPDQNIVPESSCTLTDMKAETLSRVVDGQSTVTQSERPTSAPFDDSDSCFDYSSLVSCLCRHERLLRDAATRRGVASPLPPLHKQGEPKPTSYREYLRSLRQHVELVRLVCPAEPRDSRTSDPCNGLRDSMNPTMSKLRLIPMDASAEQ